MKTFNEFIEQKKVFPMLEELFLTLIECDDPLKEVYKCCENIHPELAIVYLEQLNTNKHESIIEEGMFKSLLQNTAKAVPGIWDRVKSTATDAYRGGQSIIKNTFGAKGAVEDAMKAINSATQALLIPEIIKLANSGQLDLQYRNGKVTSLPNFFKQINDALQNNSQQILNGLTATRGPSAAGEDVRGPAQVRGMQPPLRRAKALPPTQQPQQVTPYQMKDKSKY